jgi:hypothetical protein
MGLPLKKIPNTLTQSPGTLAMKHINTILSGHDSPIQSLLQRLFEFMHTQAPQIDHLFR